jgi:hypothetical protein
MADSWHSYPELLALTEAAAGGLKESLTGLAEAVKPLDRPLRADEKHVRVARGYDSLDSRRIELPWTPAARFKDALDRWVIDIPAHGYDLSGAVILPGGLVALQDTAFISEFRSAAATWRDTGFWGMPPENFGFAHYDRPEQTCVVSLPDELAVLDEDTAYFFFNSNMAISNFGHFVHDLLSQIIVYDYLTDKLGIELRPLLLRPNEPAEEFKGKPFRYPMLNYLFEELVAPLSQVVLIDEPGVRVARCYGASLGLPDPATDDSTEIAVSAFSYARSRLVAVGERCITSAPSYRRIYVSRGDAPRDQSRDFHNLAKAEDLIADFGFRSLRVGRMSIPEVLAAFYCAEHVVGIHGAGLVNFMFSSRSVRVTELLDYPYSWPSIALMAAAVGVDLRRVDALPPTAASSGLPRLDLAQIERSLARQ